METSPNANRAHAAGDAVAENPVGASAGVPKFASLWPPEAVVRTIVRDAGKMALRRIGGKNGALQLRTACRIWFRAAVLGVGAEIVVVKGSVSHREPAAGGFLRDGNRFEVEFGHSRRAMFFKAGPHLDCMVDTLGPGQFPNLKTPCILLGQGGCAKISLRKEVRHVSGQYL